MLIEIQTPEGPRKVRVCDHCKAVCIPGGRFCSGRCAREHDRYAESKKEQKQTEPTP
jgi:hypothetical protein